MPSAPAALRRRPAFPLVAVAALALVPPAARAQDGMVAVPDGWAKGETHEHLQLCPLVYGAPPGADNDYLVDRTTFDVLDAMIDGGLQVANVMIWNNGALDYRTALDKFGPLVTGDEDPSTDGDPARFLQVGLESSGFPVSTLGHISFLNIADAHFDPELDIPYQLIDWFRQQPDVVVGAPHQMFPVELCAPLIDGPGSGFVNPPGYSFVDSSVCDLVDEGMAFPTFTFAHLFPVFLPLDVATERIDYLEAIDLAYDVGPMGFSPSNMWFGLYYKLLDLGLSPSIGGGNDVNCAETGSPLPARTYVWMDEEPLDFPTWARRLADGHATVSMGDQEVLLLDVQGRRVGQEVALPVSALLPVTVQLHAADGHDVADTIELVVGGEVVRSARVDQQDGGVFARTFLLPFTESTWVVARTRSQSTHTAAVFVSVRSQPRVDLDVANYMVMYTGYLDWNLDVAEAFGVVDDIVGDSLEEVRAYIDDGRNSFVSRRDFARGEPQGVRRYGVSARAPDRDFMPIVVDGAPVAGERRKLSVFNAIPGSTAILIVGTSDAPGIPFDGASLLVDPTTLELIQTVPVDDFGHAELSIVVPPSNGASRYLQFVVAHPQGAPQALSSSDAIAVTY